MKIFRFLEYDISEGIVRFWKRYIWIIVISVIVCIMFDRETKYIFEGYGGTWSPLGYCINGFYGRLPYHFNAKSSETFTVPFSWILQYLVLAYCIGSYVKDDMRGFGIQLMIRRKNRSLWWFSKCIFCLLVNILYFSLVFGTYYSYSWIVNGNVSLSGQENPLIIYYGADIGGTEPYMLIIITMLIPLLVGIVQSLIQIILSVYINSAAVMGIVAFMLTVSAYYGSLFLIHTYAMACRYYTNVLHPEDVKLTAEFGIPYLLVCTVFLMFFGYALIRKKNII